MPKPFQQAVTAKDWLGFLLCGLCMGTADIIPGISGGTIAFIMGFYENLLSSIKSLNGFAFKKLLQGDFRTFFNLISWKFLSGLLLGIIIAMVCLAHMVTTILNHEQYRVFLYASFLGLIIAASLLCGLQLKQWSLKSLLVFLLSASLAFLLTGSTIFYASSEDLYDVKLENFVFSKPLKNYEPSTHMLLAVPVSTISAMISKGTIQDSALVYSYNQDSYGPASEFIQMNSVGKFNLWIISCGAIAVSAMLLPGISGSYLLTILGMYATAIAALSDFAGGLTYGQFDFNAFYILANLLVGIVLGSLLFSRFVSWILDKYHDLTIAALTGFMLGALRSVWPFWSYQYALLPLSLEKGPQLEVVNPFLPSFTHPETWIAVSLVIGGAGIVFVLHFFSKRTEWTPRT